MRVPLYIHNEWLALSRTEHIDTKLRAIAEIRTWLEQAERELTHPNPSNPPKDPKVYGHGKSNTTGVTNVEFDGVTMGTLRAWESWWCNPERSKYGREEAGRDPKEECEKVRREIEARDRG